MYLPTSHATALLMMLTGMILWGSWPNTFKLVKNWRVELFYLDYAFGIFLSSILIGLTMGTFFGGESFIPQLLAADHSSWAIRLRCRRTLELRQYSADVWCFVGGIGCGISALNRFSVDRRRYCQLSGYAARQSHSSIFRRGYRLRCYYLQFSGLSCCIESSTEAGA